jgi:hypothetical protein
VCRHSKDNINKIPDQGKGFKEKGSSAIHPFSSVLAEIGITAFTGIGPPFTAILTLDVINA